MDNDITLTGPQLLLCNVFYIHHSLIVPSTSYSPRDWRHK